MTGRVAPHSTLSVIRQPPMWWMSSSKRLSVAHTATIARSARGGRIAACRLAVPPQDVPIIPTLPSHQDCAAIHSITARASSSSSGRYMSVISPSESPEPRMSTRTQAYPWRANKTWLRSSLMRTMSRFRYGMYSSTAGAGSPVAVSGSHRRADSRTPSETGIQQCSTSRTRIARAVAIEVPISLPA